MARGESDPRRSHGRSELRPAGFPRDCQRGPPRGQWPPLARAPPRAQRQRSPSSFVAADDSARPASRRRGRRRMMRRRIGIYGASDEVLALLPLLDANTAVEIAVIFDPDPGLVRERLRVLGSERMESVGARLTDDPKALSTVQLHAVIDSGLEPSFVERFPEAAARGVQIVAPLTARLLFGYGVSARDRKAELLQALHEVVESVNLTVDADELFARMLEIALGVT